MAKLNVAIVGLGMAVTPHAKSYVDLADRVSVRYAFSPSQAAQITALTGRLNALGI